MTKGAGWLFLEKGVQQVSSFVVFAVIVSMIGPEEYGLVALCGIIIAFMNNITWGLSDVIISMRIRDDERLSSLFWMITGIGGILSIISFSLAHPFAGLFNQQTLVPLLQAFSIIPFLFALSSVPIALINATMNFRIFTVRTLIASLIGGVAGIIFAIKGFGAYALVVQQVVAQAVTIIIVFYGLSWHPQLTFKFSGIKKMLKFGSGQTGSLLTKFIETQMPRFVLGYFLGPESVGHYAFIQRICGVLQDALIQPILSVIYPAISDTLDNHQKKLIIAKQAVFTIGTVMFPIVAGIILTAPVFIPVFFGQKWVATIDAMQVFIFANLFFSFNIMLQSILRAHSRIYVYLWGQITLVIFTSIGYFLVIDSGLISIVKMMTFSAFIGTMIYSVLVWKYTKLSIGLGYLSLWSPLVSALIMSISLLEIKDNDYFSEPKVINVLALVVLGATIYVLSMLIFNWKKLIFQRF